MIEDGLAELHTHLGASVASEIMWSLAHEQGIALPTRGAGFGEVTHAGGSGARYLEGALEPLA